MAFSINSVPSFHLTLKAKLQHTPKTIHLAASTHPWLGTRKHKNERNPALFSLPADSNQITTNTTEDNSKNTEKPSEDNTSSIPDVKKDTQSSQKSMKRSTLTARERLRAARVLNRADTKPLKSEFGSKVLDALRESERGKKRSRLPEAPTNMLDDSKRGMPKQGLTFDFPGGFDLFVIVLSFVLITTTMVATTYVVWKLGAIHFNEN